MKKYRYILSWMLAGTLCCLTACKKEFFELRDRGGMDAAIWDNEGAIQFFLNEAYDVIMPDFPFQYSSNNFNIHIASDENYLSADDSWTKRALGLNGVLTSNDVRYVGAKYQGSNKGDNRYFDIARCNLAITNIPAGTVLSEESKRKLLGQFYMLRAMAYFELVRIYGGVPLLVEPQNPDNLELSGRAKAKDCFQLIVSDLDSAMSKLNGVVWNDATERGKLTRAAAASYKAKVLLYWASPQFNPMTDNEHPYEPARWQEAFKASKEAYDICLASGIKLMPKYEEIFLKEGTANTEAIIVKSYSDKVAKRNQGVEARIRPQSEGGSPTHAYYASTRLLEAYTMNDGRPITSSTAYDPVLFWLNRDPRFEATIAYNGCKWKLSGNASRRQWTYLKAIGESDNRGLYCKRFSSPDLPSASVKVANDLGGSGMDWIELRFAEVMLNYAEAANETGNTGLAKDLVRELRKRANIVEGTAGNDYGLGAIGNDASLMRELITNERMVEFAFEGKRENDLRRLRKMHLLSGTLETIIFETKSDAIRTQLEAINPSTGLRYRDTLDINNKATFLNNFKYPYAHIFPSGNGGFSVPEYYYFYAFHNQFMNSSPLLEQTIGWDGGTFDPL